MKRVTVEVKIKMILDVKNDQNLDEISENITFSEIDTNNDIELITFKVIDSKIIEK
jgi:hypothetical protein